MGGFHDGCLSLALYTSEKSYAQRVRYMPSNHSTKVKQEVSVMLVLDMLHRWLNEREVFGQYEWLEQSETLIK